MKNRIKTPILKMGRSKMGKLYAFSYVLSNRRVPIQVCLFPDLPPATTPFFPS